MPFNQQGMIQPSPMSQFPQQLLQPKPQQQQGGGMGSLASLMPYIMQAIGGMGGGGGAPPTSSPLSMGSPSGMMAPPNPATAMGGQGGMGGMSGGGPNISALLQQLRQQGGY